MDEALAAVRKATRGSGWTGLALDVMEFRCSFVDDIMRNI